MLCIVPLIWTSTRGMLYDARPLNCVRNGGTTLQYGFRVPVAEIVVSGNCAAISQLSVVRRPVLVPP